MVNDRLKRARAELHPGGQEVAEYKARMGGYLDAAITLISVAQADASENLARNPECGITKKSISLLCEASERLEILVGVLCPLTANPTVTDHG